jgi:NDP-sugar pyrophosphorylase family protein
MKKSLVVLAAGMGSRFGGIKQLEPVGPAGETVLEYGLRDAERAGFEDAVFIVRRDLEGDFRAAVLDRYRGGMRARLAFQELDDLPGGWSNSAAARSRSKPWGTGHALWCARELIDAPFAVVNADYYYGPRSYALAAEHLDRMPVDGEEYALIAFELGKTLSAHGTVSRGVCATDRDGRLLGIVEHTRLRAASGTAMILSEVADGRVDRLPPDTLVSMNMFACGPRLPRLLGPLLEEFLAAREDDPKAEFYLPAAIAALIERGSVRVRALRSPERWYGITYREDLSDVRAGIQAEAER